ncbi:MAG TPA: hypothetical protein VGK27_10295 [Candidatus Deferrimicrobiaceae bacterium]|jgi:hypothetical protein
MKRYLVAAVILLMIAGCAPIATFVYKPAASPAGETKLPVKVAVLPFQDATEDFTTRGSLFVPSGLTLNLVKAGIPGTASALTPELWGKAFADDLTASGDFRSAGFFFNLSELVDEDLYIEGTVRKAYGIGTWDQPTEIALAFRALRKADNRVVWEKGVARVWTPRIKRNCGFGLKCVIDQRYEDINRAMQELFAEARTDFVRTLARLPGSRVGEDGASQAESPATPPSSGSVYETIEGILKGN